MIKLSKLEHSHRFFQVELGCLRKLYEFTFMDCQFKYSSLVGQDYKFLQIKFVNRIIWLVENFG